MSTPLSKLLSLVAAHGKSQASAFLQGEAVIAGSPDQEIWEHLARHDILWDGLTVADQDQIRDSYLEAFKQECARRLTKSDPPQRDPLLSANVATHPLPVSVAPAAPFGVDHVFAPLKSIRRYIDGLAEGPHRTAMVKGWNFMVYGMEDPGSVTLRPDWLKSITETTPATSSVVTATLVPEVVERVREALQTIMEWDLPSSGHKWDDGTPMSYGAAFGSNGERSYIQGVAESALTALRNYSPVPSPSVELLRDMIERFETVRDLHCDCTWPEDYRDTIRMIARTSLSKLNAALA